MPRGGKRKGAGRPKGTRGPHTRTVITSLEKDVLREETRAIIAPHLERLLTAQISHAEGLKYLVTRDKKTGKFIRVTEAMARVRQDAAEPDGLDTLVDEVLGKGKLPSGLDPLLRGLQDDRRALRAALERHTGTEETIEVWEKDPSVPAFTDLLNRLIDRPGEPEQAIKVSGEISLMEKIAQARRRADRSSHS